MPSERLSTRQHTLLLRARSGFLATQYDLRIVNSLVIRGLVSINRRKLIELTAEGRDLLYGFTHASVKRTHPSDKLGSYLTYMLKRQFRKVA